MTSFPAGGTSTTREDEACQAAWEQIRQFILQDSEFTVDRDLGGAFIFWIDGRDRQHQVFVARNNRGVGEYVTFELGLGMTSDVDIMSAMEAAGSTLGGVVCQEDFVSLRQSHALVALTPPIFRISVADLILATEDYQRRRKSAPESPT